MLRNVVVLVVLITLLGSILLGFRGAEILSEKTYKSVKTVIEENNK